MRFASALLLAAFLPFPAHAATPDVGWQADRLDHVMLWTDNVDKTTSVLSVKLGFQVVPGGDFGGGVANRLVRLHDDAYLELLYTTQPPADLAEGVRQELAELRSGTGAKMFAVHARDLDAADRFLRAAGFELDPPSAMSYDPDGPGPQPAVPASWRTVSLTRSPFSFGGTFLIEYAKDHDTAQGLADAAVRTAHPNGASGFTSIWVLSSDLDVDVKAFERMGFARRGDIDLPQVGARGVRLQAGSDAIVLLSPQGDGPAAKALAARGGHVFGLSFGVDDLERAQRIVERGYGVQLARYAGPDGDAVLAPTQDELGLFIEFHSMPAH